MNKDARCVQSCHQLYLDFRTVLLVLNRIPSIESQYHLILSKLYINFSIFNSEHMAIKDYTSVDCFHPS